MIRPNVYVSLVLLVLCGVSWATHAAADMSTVRRDLAKALPRNEFQRKVADIVDVRGPGASVYKDRANGVVIVGGKGSIGTGALLNGQGEIVTNEHVARTAHRADGGEWLAIWFKPADGAQVDLEKFLTAKVIKKDPQHDLAIIRLTTPLPAGATLIPLASARQDVGSEVFVIGHPQGLFWSLTQGIISQIRPGWEWVAGDDGIRHKATTIQTQAPINHGNSGGPLLDPKGEILGIVSFGHADAQGLSFAIAVDHVRELMARSGPDPTPGSKPGFEARPAKKPDPQGSESGSESGSKPKSR